MVAKINLYLLVSISSVLGIHQYVSCLNKSNFDLYVLQKSFKHSACNNRSCNIFVFLRTKYEFFYALTSKAFYFGNFTKNGSK
jgi:hypothetical protein